MRHRTWPRSGRRRRRVTPRNSSTRWNSVRPARRSSAPPPQPRDVQAERVPAVAAVRQKQVIPVSDTQAYRQFGNSVVVPVVEAVAGLVVPELLSVMNGHPQSFELKMPRISA
ncbi:MAG: DNA cytosine methyltransferase [Acidobacteria bacterium]|nr:DNA cytosine methyltransferase [Acidobacteriota bacterium]